MKRLLNIFKDMRVIIGILSFFTLVSGVVATIKVRTKIKEEPEKLSTRTKIKRFWRYYIPTITGLVSTFGLGLWHFNSLQKMTKLITAQSEEITAWATDAAGNVVAKVASERKKGLVDPQPVITREIVLCGDEQLMYDSISGRYFASTMEKVRETVNQLNHDMLMESTYISVNEFYRWLDIPENDMGSELGWNVERLIQVSFTTKISDDNKACIVVIFDEAPTTRYREH